MKKYMNNKASIGIVTFHNALNYGANLQTYALQKYINENIGKSEIIDFIPFLKARRNIIKNVLRFIKMAVSKKYRLSIKRKNAFLSFQKKHYNISDKRLYLNDECEEYLSRYKTIISGSDQILNTDLTSGCNFYYLPFSGNYKKVSFSSSYGKETLSNLDIEFIKKYLSDFDYLSFREESGIKITKQLLPNKEMLLTCDPVFLLSKDNWLELINESDTVMENKEYILLYAMERSEHIEKCVSIVKAREKIPVYAIYGDDKITINGVDVIIKTAGPIEFLKLINNSKIFITNSFHGSAFSFIFGKKAYICSHSTKNTRIETLLKIAKCEDSIYDDINKNLVSIDGQAGYRNIANDIINRSKEYLHHSLK